MSKTNVLKNLMDANRFSHESIKNQIIALRDIPKTWHVIPEFRLIYKLRFFFDF